MLHRVPLLLAVGASLWWPASGHAQSDSAAQATPRAEFLAAVARLTPGKQVRVAVAGHRRTGAYLGTAGDNLTLGAPAPPSRIPLGSIDTLWARGTAWKPGAIVGGSLGAVLIGLYVAAVAGVCDSADCPEPATAGVVGGLVGAAGGALVGAGIGALIPKWKRRYP